MFFWGPAVALNIRDLDIAVTNFLSLSLLQAGLDPLGEGSATWVLRLHSALFSTSIRSTRKSSMLYFTTSIHLFSLSSPTPLSTYVCLQDSHDTILFFSALYMPQPSQPGLSYFVRDARYSEDATDIVIPFLVSQREAENTAVLTQTLTNASLYIACCIW